MPRDRHPLPPLDHATLDRLALRYVERFQTTRHKLSAYLRRKIRERGWSGTDADPDGVADRLAGLGYVDDASFAASKAGAMRRRGLGSRRVAGALRQAGIADPLAAETLDEDEEAAEATALAFARRRRIGPFGPPADRPQQQRQIAAMLRAGHDLGRARRIVAMPREPEPEPPN